MVVEGVINAWNRVAVKSVQSTVGACLSREFSRMVSPGASAAAWGAALGLRGSDFRYLRDESGQIPVDMPNPLLMMSDTALAANLPIDAVVGLAHGAGRFGAAHEHTLAAKSSYALALRCCGSQAEVNDARTLLREATDVYRELFPENHPLTLAAEVNLAVVLRAAGDRDEARRLDERALARLTEQLGEQHPYTLAAATNLAGDLFLAGSLAQAQEMSWTTYEKSVDALGAEHPDTLVVAVNAALDKVAGGDESGGQALLEQAHKTMSSVLGVNHPATLDAMRGRRAECDIEAPPA